LSRAEEEPKKPAPDADALLKDRFSRLFCGPYAPGSPPTSRCVGSRERVVVERNAEEGLD